MAKSKPKSASELRQLAEEKLHVRLRHARPTPAEDSARLVHELQVHQIELEMQNEELRLAQAEAEEATRRYTDLYDFAPVGYLSLGPDGAIKQLNLTAATKLGMERSKLAGRRIAAFVAEPDRTALKDFLDGVFSGAYVEPIEIGFVVENRPNATIRIQATLAEGGVQCFAVLVDVTERNEANRALRQSQATLQAAMDQSQAGIAIADAPSGLLRYVNDAGLLIRGGEREAALDGVDVKQYVARWHLLDLDGTPLKPEDVPLARAALFGETRSREFIIRRAPGDDRTVLAHAGPIRGDDGLVTAAVVVFIDITDERRAQREKQAIHARLAFALAAAKAGTWEWDLATNVNIWSDELWSLYGLEPGSCESSYDAWLTSVCPADRDALQAQLAAAVGKGEEINIEWRVNLPTVPERWLMSRGSPERDASGKVVRYLGVVIDITDRKRAETMAREAAARHQSILQTAMDGFWILDMEGRILEVNDAYCRMSGYGPEELLRMRVPDIEVIESEEAVARRIETLRAAGQDRFESQHRRKDGTTCEVEVSIQLQSAAAGRIVAFLRDITARKQTEASLRAAKLAAEAAIQVKDQFLAKLSHELRTPLTPVLLAVSHWQAQPGIPDALRSDLAMVCRNLQLEVELLGDLLDVNRIIYGKLAVRPQAIHIHPAIEEAVAIVKAGALSKNQKLESKLGAAHDCVQADPMRLQQVLWNLLRNAIKFTPEGGSISLLTTNDTDGWLQIEITDTGMGIAPELLPRLFEAFEQGGIAVNREHGGLGLGLTISQSLVQAHGGTITAASDGKGKGATFTVRFPTIPASEVIAPAALAPRAVAAAPLKILLVEDDPVTVRILAFLLGKAGHKVETAGDVATGLERLKEPGFDLMISDLGLPDGSGLDLLRKATAAGSVVPAIACSGYGMEDDLRATREAGFAQHLVKPVNLLQLETAIAKVMARK